MDYASVIGNLSAPPTAGEVMANRQGLEFPADALGLLDRVRRRAQEMGMPFESALKQALTMYLHDHPVEGKNASPPARL